MMYCMDPWLIWYHLAAWLGARWNLMSQWCNRQHQRWKFHPGEAVNWDLLIFQYFMALGEMTFKIPRCWGERWNWCSFWGCCQTKDWDVYIIYIYTRINRSQLFSDLSYPSRRVDRRLAGGVVKKLGWIKGAPCFLWCGERMHTWCTERYKRKHGNLLLFSDLIARIIMFCFIFAWFGATASSKTVLVVEECVFWVVHTCSVAVVFDDM